MLSSFDKPTFETFFDVHVIIKYIRINKVTIVGIGFQLMNTIRDDELFEFLLPN